VSCTTTASEAQNLLLMPWFGMGLGHKDMVTRAGELMLFVKARVTLVFLFHFLENRKQSRHNGLSNVEGGVLS
jgi:hypothetical protein